MDQHCVAPRTLRFYQTSSRSAHAIAKDRTNGVSLSLASCVEHSFQQNCFDFANVYWNKFPSNSGDLPQYELERGEVWLPSGLSTAHWLQTVAVLVIMGSAVSGACLVVKVFDNVGIRTLAVGMALLAEYVCLR